MKSIDVHAHILPDCFLALADSGSLADVALVRDAVGAPQSRPPRRQHTLLYPRVL